MSKMKTFAAELELLNIDPPAWSDSRAAGRDFPDYRLARDLEDLVIGAVFDRNIELKDGETLRDVALILSTAAERWPLTSEAA